jgi:hypothetical protein
MELSKAEAEDELKETRELARCLDRFIEAYRLEFRGTAWEEAAEKAAATADRAISRMKSPGAIAGKAK